MLKSLCAAAFAVMLLFTASALAQSQSEASAVSATSGAIPSASPAPEVVSKDIRDMVAGIARMVASISIGLMVFAGILVYFNFVATFAFVFAATVATTVGAATTFAVAVAFAPIPVAINAIIGFVSAFVSATALVAAAFDKRKYLSTVAAVHIMLMFGVIAFV